MKSILNTFKCYFFSFFPAVAVFSGSLFNPSDADLGWHLKYGEYFFQTGKVLTENIFSSSMTDYKWVNSSWITDLITYATFHNFGFIGLTFLAALAVAVTFYIFSKAAGLSFWEQALLAPLIIHLEEPLFSVSFRGHLLSLLLLGFLYRILIGFSRGNKKLLILTIPLFALWSNTHGEFILGLAVCFFFLFFYALGSLVSVWGKSSSGGNFIPNLTYPAAVMASSFISPLVNPFHIGVYTETFRHFGNPLQRFIVEWLPLDTYSQAWWELIVWGIVALCSLLILKSRKKLRDNLPVIGVFLILYILSFWMRRYVWAMYLISIPVVKNFFEYLKPDSPKVRNTISAVILIGLYIFNIFYKNPGMSIPRMNWENYCHWYAGCSAPSAQFILKNNLTERLLTLYNWGGYLIWNFPQIKPSIDGRMHLWRDESGYSAFADYYQYEQNWTDINKSDYTAVYINLTKPLYTQMTGHAADKTWKMVYKDDFAAVFTRNQ